MPSKKKKYNARFPAGRIKKIMQTDEEVGKVAQAVPVIISRTLELFVESLLTKSMQITQARNAKTLTPSHMKQCILSENRFDFLKDLVKNIPDASTQEDNENNLLFDTTTESRDTKVDNTSTTLHHHHKPQTSHNIAPHEQSTSRKSSTVIKYGPAVTHSASLATSTSTRRGSASRSNSSSSCSYSKSENLCTKQNVEDDETDSDEDMDKVIPAETQSISNKRKSPSDNVPPLIPIASNFYSQNRNDSLVIDEDYDN